MLAADGPLYQFNMPIAPFLEAFVEIGHQLEEDFQVRLRLVKPQDAFLDHRIGDGRQGDIALSQLRRDRDAVLSSVERCSKVLVLHEDTKTGGFGGEIAATIAEEAFEHLDAPVRRLAAPDSPVPFAPSLEKAFIPQVDDVAGALRELAAY